MDRYFCDLFEEMLDEGMGGPRGYPWITEVMNLFRVPGPALFEENDLEELMIL